MNNEIQIFNYKNNKIRMIEREGQVWFVAKDVCDVLDLKNARKAVKELYDNEKNTVTISYGNRGNPNITVINEPGLYKLIFKSRKAEAKSFQDWVFYKVLPDIRKHGMYMTDKTVETLQTDPEAFNKLLEKYVAEREKVRQLEAKIDADMPYTNVGRIVVALPGSITFAEAAKMFAQHGLDIGRNRLLKLCREKKLLCEQKCQWNKPTQKGIDKGIVNIELDLSGNVRFTTRPMLTPNGFKEMYEFLLSLQRPLELLWEEEE